MESRSLLETNKQQHMIKEKFGGVGTTQTITGFKNGWQKQHYFAGSARGLICGPTGKEAEA
jgi:hypothetical protein